MATFLTGSLLLLSLVSIYVYWNDSNELDRLARELTTQDRSEIEKIASISNYVTEIPNRPESERQDYFLFPFLSPLKPAATQVIRDGGDCAYRARVFIVLLNKLDIRASKMCLHDAEGIPRHAVSIVQSELGPLIVDTYFGIICSDIENNPLTVNYIAEHLDEIVREESENGNKRAAKYPINRYPFTQTTSIN